MNTKTRVPINWVICAAGRGSRFKNAGINIPKPLIKLNGLTLLERSLASLDIKKEDKLIIITQKSDEVKFKLEKKIADKFNKLVWEEIGSITKGQLETFYLIKNKLMPNSSVSIFNCDTYFSSKSFLEMLNDNRIDAIVPCGFMQGDAWSFFQTDSDQNVQKVKEKERISDNASVGLYYFKDADLLVRYTKSLIESYAGDKELYVSSLYAKLIEDGFKVKVSMVDEFKAFGTLDQIKQDWGLSLIELKEQNEAT